MSNRLTAVLVHLAISCVCAAGLAFLVFGVWYPAPLAHKLGGDSIFFLMLVVDVVVGPLLTAVVYGSNKKSLKFDLLVVVLFQICAMAYGVYVMSVARPAWLVFAGVGFDLVQANSVEYNYVKQAEPEYRSPSWLGPKWVAANLPVDAKKRNELVWAAFQGGADLPQRPDLYSPLSRNSIALQKYAMPLRDLQKFNDEAKLVAELGRWPSADSYLPIRTKGGALVVLLNRGRSDPLAIVDLRPY